MNLILLFPALISKLSQVLCVIPLSSLTFATLPNLISSANLINISARYVT